MLPRADATQMETQPRNRSSAILNTAVKPVQIGGQDFCVNKYGRQPWASGQRAKPGIWGSSGEQDQSPDVVENQVRGRNSKGAARAGLAIPGPRSAQGGASG